MGCWGLQACVLCLRTVSSKTGPMLANPFSPWSSWCIAFLSYAKAIHVGHHAFPFGKCNIVGLLGLVAGPKNHHSTPSPRHIYITWLPEAGCSKIGPYPRQTEVTAMWPTFSGVFIHKVKFMAKHMWLHHWIRLTRLSLLENYVIIEKGAVASLQCSLHLWVRLSNNL